MEDTEKEISDSLADQQDNRRPEPAGGRMRSKQPSDCGNYGADSEEDSSNAKGKVSVSKSKVI